MSVQCLLHQDSLILDLRVSLEIVDVTDQLTVISINGVFVSISFKWAHCICAPNN